MGLFDYFRFGRKSADPLALWAEMLRAGRNSKAGPTVNLDNALKVATLFACLKVLSQGVAQVPFKLYQEQNVDGLANIQPARDHRLYDLLTSQPNDWQTSFEFREQLVLHAALGNAYVWKNRIPSGLAEFILLNPGRMAVEQKDEFAAPVYEYTTKEGRRLDFAADQIWHVRGPSWSGFAGLDVLQIAREALGLSIATEESHSNLHAKGVRPSGIYSVDGNLNPTQQKQLKEWIEKDLAGADNAGAAMILDRGAKWVSTAMTGLDAQHLETRKHQIEEVCRFMGVMPIMVGYSDKATTYASSEQMFLAHVIHTLSPWYARIEQSADVNLLTKQERNKGYYFKFNANGLLRGAAKDRAEYYGKALGSGGSQGWMTPDEVRALEELNPMGGKAAELPSPPVPVADPKAAEAAKSLTVLESKLDRLQDRPQPAPPAITVNVNQEPTTIKVDSPITVNTPDVKAAEPSHVTVQNDIHVPQGPAPVVNNEVNVPKQDLPSVTLEATLPPLTVNAVLPARKTTSTTDIQRDGSGNIVKSSTNSIEKDA